VSELALTTDQVELARDELRQFVVDPQLLSFVTAYKTWVVSWDEFDDFLSKPWKWAYEYAAWQAAGEPMGEGDAGWDAFGAVCDRA
jgi:Fe-S-cluster formation regulator IscX/YfhJ